MALVCQWVQKFASIVNDFSDAPKPTIGVDSEGNFYVAYVCVNPISGQTNVGMIDICVTKISPDGTALWFRQQPSFDTNQDDVDPSITVDTNGDIYVTYSTSGEVSGQITTFITTAIVVFKLNSNGDTLWVKQANDFNVVGQNSFPTIGSDANGYVYVAYTSYDDTLGDYYDHIVLFKLDTNGNTVWVKNTHDFNTPGGNYNPSLAVDDTGNCYIAYYCDGQEASGESVVGGYDIVIFKTNTNGDLLWIRQRPTFNTTANDFYPAITVDTYGAIYVAYETDGVVSGQSSAGGIDIVVFKMDTNGNVIWNKQSPTFNTVDSDYHTSIGVDTMGMVYISYATTGITSGQTLTGTQDIVVMQMDTDGNIITILQQSAFNTPYDNYYPSLTTDINGNCGIAYYSMNIDSVPSSQELVVFKIAPLVCVHGETQILLADGTTRSISTLTRGDIVAPNYQVARICKERIDTKSYISLMVFEPFALGNQPTHRLVVTPNHPIFYKNARRPAKCFAQCHGVTLYDNVPMNQVQHLFTSENEVYLYDLQFEHDGSYIANGLEVQSRSPYSCYDPLPRDLYYDKSLYCNERVSDSMDHTLPLETETLQFNLLVLKNKHHEHLVKQSTNHIRYKEPKQIPVSIMKYT